jgi:uncharacterized UPF0160 family protein
MKKKTIRETMKKKERKKKKTLDTKIDSEFLDEADQIKNGVQNYTAFGGCSFGC